MGVGEAIYPVLKSESVIWRLYSFEKLRLCRISSTFTTTYFMRERDCIFFQVCRHAYAIGYEQFLSLNIEWKEKTQAPKLVFDIWRKDRRKDPKQCDPIFCEKNLSRSVFWENVPLHWLANFDYPENNEWFFHYDLKNRVGLFSTKCIFLS